MNLHELSVAVFNTVLVLLICISLSLLLGTLLAVLLQRTNVIGRQLIWIALGSQIAVPLYVFAGGWSAGFGMQGWFTSLGLWDSVGLTGESTAAVMFAPGTPAALIAVALVYSFAAIPWVTFIMSLGIRWANRGQEEQALLDGGWRFALLSVLLPKLRIWLVAAAIWTAIPVMTEMVISNLYQVPIVAEQVYLDASRGRVSVLTYMASFFICTLPIAGIVLLILRRMPDWQAVMARSEHHRAKPWDLKSLRWPMSVLAWCMILFLVGLPILNLVLKSGWQTTTGEDGLPSYGWHAGRFATTAYETATLFHKEFFWSFMLAACSASAALGVAIAVCSSRNLAFKWGFTILCLLAVATPGPIVGMGLIWLLNRPSPQILGVLYDQSLLAPVLAQQCRLIPLAWLLAFGILASISKSSREQAAMDGLGRFAFLRVVIWPQTGALWIVSWLLLAVLSIGELSSTILVLPPMVTTLSIRLFEMLHFGMRHQDSGLCGALMLFGWVMSFVFWKTLRER